MPAILEALNQAGLYEHVSGNPVTLVVVPASMYYKILRMGIAELYSFGPTYVFVPCN